MTPEEKAAHERKLYNYRQEPATKGFVVDAIAQYNRKHEPWWEKVLRWLRSPRQ